ncbi:MAG: FAD-dependent oxidoreductase, partial [Mariprofundaceae bacterium]|nr:FAD-dependent oxidoreductase [Mariprofundaceae bacterium]
MHTAVIGGGLSGLSAAIRLAQQGAKVDLFEAAPALGGRTRSFFEPQTGQWVDNGPHLLSGAYQETLALLDEASAADNIHWQSSLQLPLWDKARGHFMLAPGPKLPLALALPLACARLPGHTWADIPALLRLARAMKQSPDPALQVNTWLKAARLPDALILDLLEPLCIGAMNEPLHSANAASFAGVLRDAFSGHAHARLGWFRKPLSEALIAPLNEMAEKLGVRIYTACRIKGVRPCKEGFELQTSARTYAARGCILALPLRSTQQLMGWPVSAETRRIRNIHLWINNYPALPEPFIGGIGTVGQWFFDISSQMQKGPALGKSPSLRHFCAVISADEARISAPKLQQNICLELQQISATQRPVQPDFIRTISEHRATTSICTDSSYTDFKASLPAGLFDASEAPVPGEIPATIEYAIKRGNLAATQCLNHFN